jgi:anti-sigma B factor antagonist
MGAAQPLPTPDHVARPAAGPYEPPQPFRIDVRPERDAVRVRPVGEFELATADRVRAQIDELVHDGFARVILDLRGVTFLDSAGLHVLIDADASSRSDGWELLVHKSSGSVTRAIELVGLHEQLRFVED